MIEEFEHYLKKRKRQKMLKKIKQAVKTKVREQIDKRKETDDIE